ncbi:4-(cytidine 5'-diphospho)-2-C-methyl-D-erythritol kinase [Cytophagaceae bacterium 50C-KIRBA]|uniref:4-diphosphocytidyl-2-C-methyl-D-erythritol kinase n=1 Tax=Aquirufa beregesia TaxID=2516556 RepID=A0ABX0EUW2_9BACT|nr:4-(cytidine 5'-diphospho)-2-C-methyl-D-erythritol kinase [Aquirufa beregesia]NGZ43843.1 4-(cytidine 5'-diphospho)-2-C-methyl-D-erythritol kinase [Aquirufa beregesia]
MLLFPNAKINIGLYITSKRLDGFHELETCFFHVPWTDILEISPSQQVKFSSSGLPISGEVQNNLCLRAYHALAKDFKIPPVHIHLHKIIPMGAGLGGGSADAAFTLMGLRDLFDLPLSNKQLIPYTQQLGSDCAFFLFQHAQLGKGKGDELSPISCSLQGCQVVLIYPNLGISTQEAYAQVKPQATTYDLAQSIAESMERWKDLISNDFELSLFPKYPILAQIKQDLYDQGAVYAAMSGSGSTIFGIFKKEVDLAERWADFTCFQGVIA